MIIKLDVLGQPIGEGDFILCSYTHDKSRLEGFKVLGFTPTGILRLKGKNSYGREKLHDPETDAIKITKEQFELLK